MKDKKKQIDLHMLKESWYDIVSFTIIIGSIYLLHPPIWITLFFIAGFILSKQIYYDNLSIKNLVKSLLTVLLIIGLIRIVYIFVGGLWAFIIIEVLFVSWYIYGSRHFIKEADTQMKEQLDILLAKKRGTTNGRGSTETKR